LLSRNAFELDANEIDFGTEAAAGALATLVECRGQAKYHRRADPDAQAMGQRVPVAESR